MATKSWGILIVFKMNVKDDSAIETVHKDDTVLIYDAFMMTLATDVTHF